MVYNVFLHFFEHNSYLFHLIHIKLCKIFFLLTTYFFYFKVIIINQNHTFLLIKLFAYIFNRFQDFIVIIHFMYFINC